VANASPTCPRSGWRLLAIAALIAIAGCSADPQNLRGPGRRKGQAYRTETKVEMKNGKLVIKPGGRSEEATCDLVATNVEDDVILEVEGGRVTKMETTFVSDDGTLTIRAGRESHQQTERGPLVGEKVLRELPRSPRPQGATWKNTLVGKEPNAKQKTELDLLQPADEEAEIYPEGKVKPGHSWKVDPERLRKQFGPSCTSLSGKASMTFVRTETIDGELCAIINVTKNLKGKMRLDEKTEMDVKWTLKGVAHRSIKAGYTIKSSLSGTMKMSGTIVEEGKRVHLEMSGPVTIETIQKRK
jgi:hypothetical protein